MVESQDNADFAQAEAEAVVRDDWIQAEKRMEEYYARQEQLEEKSDDEEKKREEQKHAQRLANAREEATVRAAAQSEAEQRLALARQNSAQAWGWYRDKDSLAPQMEEEKAEAAAQKQFEKDLDSLKRRKGSEWRGHYDTKTGTWKTRKEYSVDDEAVRRVAMAREEKEAAEKHLAEIEKNTAGLADKLDELLTMKG